MSSIIDSTSLIMSEFSPEFSVSVSSAPISSLVNIGTDVLLSTSTVSGSSASEIVMLSTKLATSEGV